MHRNEVDQENPRFLAHCIDSDVLQLPPLLSDIAVAPPPSQLSTHPISFLSVMLSGRPGRAAAIAASQTAQSAPPGRSPRRFSSPRLSPLEVSLLPDCRLSKSLLPDCRLSKVLFSPTVASRRSSKSRHCHLSKALFAVYLNTELSKQITPPVAPLRS